MLPTLPTNSEKRKFINDNDNIISIVFHMAAISHHFYIASFSMNIRINGEAQEIETLRKYRAGYLTGWGFMFQTWFLFLAVAHDILRWSGRHESRIGKKIKYWRDLIFSGLVVPITIFVTTMFWSLFLIDRELVFPTVYDNIVPWWFNHCVHTNIFIIVCIETLLQARRRPVNELVETILVATTVVAYAIVYYSIYFLGDRWLYQVFALMNWWQVCLFQLGIWGSSYLFYWMQFPINRLIHGTHDEPEVVETKLEVVNSSVSTISDEHSRMDHRKGFSTNFDRAWSQKYKSLRQKFENAATRE